MDEITIFLWALIGGAILVVLLIVWGISKLVKR